MLTSQPYAGCSDASATMIASRVVLASTLAAATDEQVMSALIRTVTGGGCSQESRSLTEPSSSNSAGAGRETQS